MIFPLINSRRVNHVLLSTREIALTINQRISVECLEGKGCDDEIP